MTRTPASALALAGLLLVLISSSQAAPGSLDPSFGADGTVTTTFGRGATALALQPDGKIVALGSVANGFALVRYEPDGSLDQQFGLGGRIATVFDDYTTPFPEDVALQRDGKIVVAGFVSGGPPGFVLERFRMDGTPDHAFGVVSTPFGDYGRAYGVAVQPDDKVVAAGGSVEGFALARYKPDGSLDRSFGSDGRATAPGGFATALILQPDGKIVVAGDGADSFVLARFDPDGSIDDTFGDGGLVTTQMGHFDQLEDVALQSDGKIVAVGWTSTLESWVSAVARFNSDGSLDAGFGSGGRVIGTSPSEFPRSVAIQADGKIVLAGGAGTLSGFALTRLQGDGSPDESFGVDGKVVTTFRSGQALRWAEAYGVAIQPDGKIVAAGQSTDGVALARYLVTPGCVVPDTVGTWVPEAKAALATAGCTVGAITRLYSRELGKGFVLRQTPKAGASLPKGTSVDLLVSKGRRRR